MHLFKLFKPLFLASCCLLLWSCSTEPRPIAFGTDNCDFCKMTISDERYGAEIVTKKGRIYVFDDVHCVRGFLQESEVNYDEVHGIYLVDFAAPAQLIPAKNSYLLQNEELKSPMGSNIAAFSEAEQFQQYQSQYSGIKIIWEEYLK